MNIQNLKIATYAFNYKLKGYQLLKNPKGVHSTTVKMLKHTQILNPETLDVQEVYSIIEKDFAHSFIPEHKINLSVDYLTHINPKTQQPIVKKASCYVKTNVKTNGSGIPLVYKEKGFIDTEELQNRNLEPLKNIAKTIEEDVLDLSVASKSFAKIKKQIKNITFKELLLEKFKQKEQQSFEFSQKYQKSFIATLLKNLKQ